MGEVGKQLAARAATRSITLTENDIVIFLLAKLKEDTIRDGQEFRVRNYEHYSRNDFRKCKLDAVYIRVPKFVC